MANNEEKTYADSDLVNFFQAYFSFHKGHPNHKLEETEISMSFYSALAGLDRSFSSCDFILSMKKDFEIISKQLEHFARVAQRDVSQREGKRDKYSSNETYYTVPEITMKWNISGSGVRKAIKKNGLEYVENEGAKCKYLVLKEVFEEYAKNHNIRLRVAK